MALVLGGPGEAEGKERVSQVWHVEIRQSRQGFCWPHAFSHNLEVCITTTGVGEDEEGMPVNLPVGLQFAPQTGRQRHHAILVALAVADEQFVFGALDIVDGQGQAFA